jgi:hypothetical protein
MKHAPPRVQIALESGRLLTVLFPTRHVYLCGRGRHPRHSFGLSKCGFLATGITPQRQLRAQQIAGASVKHVPRPGGFASERPALDPGLYGQPCISDFGDANSLSIQVFLSIHCYRSETDNPPVNVGKVRHPFLSRSESIGDLLERGALIEPLQHRRNGLGRVPHTRRSGIIQERGTAGLAAQALSASPRRAMPDHPRFAAALAGRVARPGRSVGQIVLRGCLEAC